MSQPRPSLASVRRYLDQLTLEELERKRLLEDLYGVEDGPELDLLVALATRGSNGTPRES